ncbi:hypothetical protein Vadar_000510 [Vaccinium darrowii]|uniref:Uncharacterized protein n=1 Tax=Vaccinium darrowii TaxID=229202 RepID=A0ACB7X6M7_9ERIC|nr:hypothetical protein Vadar_000510 [Vaccinium darrowii]
MSIFLPNKRSKLTNQQFGFVKFSDKKDALKAIEGINEKWFWNKKLVVQMAKYGDMKKSADRTRLIEKGKKKVWVPKPSNLKNKRHVYAESSRQADGPITHGAGSATLHTKLQCFDVQPVEARDEFIKDKRIENWVEDIKQWNGEAAIDERLVWISCYGMPINGWSYQTFKLIGDSFGNFLQADEDTLKADSFVRGRILIATEQKPLPPFQEEEDEADMDAEISKTNDRWMLVQQVMDDSKADRSGNFQDGEILLEPNKEALQFIEHGEEYNQPADQQSQIPKVAQLIELEDNEVNKEGIVNSHLSHGLESLVESSTGLMAIGLNGDHNDNKDSSISEALCINEQGFINSQLNVRASQIEGINLQVELRPSQQRKLIREFVRNCIEEFEEVANSLNEELDEF